MHHKMVGLTEALLTDTAVVGFAVHVDDQVHSKSDFSRESQDAWT